VQQGIRAVEGVRHLEFGLENPYRVPAAQRADAVGLGRAGLEPGQKKGLVVPRQLGRLPGALGRQQGVDPAVTVGVNPVLHRPAAPAERLGDVGCIPPSNRLHHGPELVPLHRVLLHASQTLQFPHVPRGRFGHAHLLLGFPASCRGPVKSANRLARTT
jgi:hypothetical protein